MVTAADLVDRLAGRKTLGAAPREELAWLAAQGSLRHLNEGDVLTAKNGLVENLFVVLTGHVAIVETGVSRSKMEPACVSSRRRSVLAMWYHGRRQIASNSDEPRSS